MNNLDKFKIHKTDKDNRNLVFFLNQTKSYFISLEDIIEDWEVTVYTPDAQQYCPIKDGKEYVRFVFYNTKYDKTCDCYIDTEQYYDGKTYQQKINIFFELFAAVRNKLDLEIREGN